MAHRTKRVEGVFAAVVQNVQDRGARAVISSMSLLASCL